MATQVIDIELYHHLDTGTNGNYFGTALRYATSEDWAGKMAGAGNLLTFSTGEVYVHEYLKADDYSFFGCTDIVADLSDYSMLTCSGGSIWVWCSYHGYRDALWGAGSANNEWTLCMQNEDVRGLAPAYVNYQECIQGANGPGTTYSDARFDSTVDQANGGAGQYLEFPFNAAGLAYINSLGTKTYMETTALFTIVPYGVVAGVAPTWIDGSSRNRAQFSEVWVELEYDDTAQTMQVNPGSPDAWKNVQNSKINISGSWRQIVEAKINIGDAWKDIR